MIAHGVHIAQIAHSISVLKGLSVVIVSDYGSIS